MKIPGVHPCPFLFFDDSLARYENLFTGTHRDRLHHRNQRHGIRSKRPPNTGSERASIIFERATLNVFVRVSQRLFPECLHVPKPIIVKSPAKGTCLQGEDHISTGEDAHMHRTNDFLTSSTAFPRNSDELSLVSLCFRTISSILVPQSGCTLSIPYTGEAVGRIGGVWNPVRTKHVHGVIKKGGGGE